ncbi:glutamate racemase [Ligilactobacillus sp. WC1T17]|uniref:Glutamate racemase n=1 Tax=Ligilactobacillus ruminis TaxID=1623 RepID=A0ABY1AA68_9LACO|nr:glutamate racemase [Ligilactobacillus ruminis]
MDVVKNKRPIGVFDSGLGGISVLKECVKLMPNEDFIFFGDSQNAPYGIKTVGQVYQLSKNIVEYFVNQDVKAIVIACNTATSAAAKELRQEYPDLPIVGLEPALKPAVLHKEHSNILVMATKLTLREDKFNHLMQQYEDQANIMKLPATDLVEFVERGEIDTPELKQYLRRILKPYLGKIDSVVLGCTHFPFAAKAIQEIVGENVYVIDGAPGAARELKRLLVKGHLEQDPTSKGTVIFHNSNPDPKEIELSKRLFNL